MAMIVASILNPGRCPCLMRCSSNSTTTTTTKTTSTTTTTTNSGTLTTTTTTVVTRKTLWSPSTASKTTAATKQRRSRYDPPSPSPPHHVEATSRTEAAPVLGSFEAGFPTVPVTSGWIDTEGNPNPINGNPSSLNPNEGNSNLNTWIGTEDNTSLLSRRYTGGSPNPNPNHDFPLCVSVPRSYVLDGCGCANDASEVSLGEDGMARGLEDGVVHGHETFLHSNGHEDGLVHGHEDVLVHGLAASMHSNGTDSLHIGRVSEVSRLAGVSQDGDVDKAPDQTLVPIEIPALAPGKSLACKKTLERQDVLKRRDVLERLAAMGFTDEDGCLSCLEHLRPDLPDKLQLLLSAGLSQEQVKRVISRGNFDGLCVASMEKFTLNLELLGPGALFRMPGLAQLTLQNLQSKMAFFQSIGMDMERLTPYVHLFKVKLETLNFRLSKLMSLGMSHEMASQLIHHYPAILDSRSEDVIDRLQSQRKLSKETLCKVFTRHPFIIFDSYKLKVFESKLDIFQSLGCDLNSPAFIDLFMTILRQALRTLKSKIHLLHSRGLCNRSIVKFLELNPSALVYPKEELVKKIDYLLNVLELDTKELVDSPPLTLSLEEQLDSSNTQLCGSILQGKTS